VPANSLALGAQRGVDLSQFRSRSITKEKVRAADLIIVMEPGQARDIAKAFGIDASGVLIAGDLDPAIGSRTIRDPWNQSAEIFEAAFNRLDRCAAALVAAIPATR
jgi:protein-tyrosine-phosphatase